MEITFLSVFVRHELMVCAYSKPSSRFLKGRTKRGKSYCFPVPHFYALAPPIPDDGVFNDSVNIYRKDEVRG
jgi:hypothetical protein